MPRIAFRLAATRLIQRQNRRDGVAVVMIAIGSTRLRDVDVAGDLLVRKRLNRVAKQLPHQPCCLCMKSLNLGQVEQNLAPIDYGILQWSTSGWPRNDGQREPAPEVVDDVQRTLRRARTYETIPHQQCASYLHAQNDSHNFQCVSFAVVQIQGLSD